MARFEIGDIIQADSGSDLPKNREYRVIRYEDNHYIAIGNLDCSNLIGIVERSNQYTQDGFWKSHENNYRLLRKGNDQCGKCRNMCRGNEKCEFYQENS